jgi:hypothetical protein
MCHHAIYVIKKEDLVLLHHERRANRNCIQSTILIATSWWTTLYMSVTSAMDLLCSRVFQLRFWTIDVTLSGFSGLYGWFLTNLAVFRCICSTCLIWVFCWGFQIGVAYSTIGRTRLWYALSFTLGGQCFKFRFSVTSMVQNLNWNTLEQRRSMADVTLMYKVVHQLVAIAVCYMPTPATVTRTRNSHSLKFSPYHCRINTYQHSFFPRTVTIWNTLSEPVTVQSS